jgi:membrane associated rhomboid family serine protease
MIPIRDTIPSRTVPLVLWGIILLNALVFLYELSLPPERLEQLVNSLGLVPARLERDPDAAWTLLTCMFLHGGWMHILGNMWFLYIFGDNVEDQMGSVRFLLFYLLCGLAAGLTHDLTNAGSSVPTIGASGAIAGVLGAYFLLFPRATVITLLLVGWPLLIEIPAYVYLGIWFLTQLGHGTFALLHPSSYENVAWWAHLGGFAAGMLLAPFFRQSPQQYRPYYPDEYRPW